MYGRINVNAPCFFSPGNKRLPPVSNASTKVVEGAAVPSLYQVPSPPGGIIRCDDS
jgi:hypothetical protein